jgi:hypothetical protein
VCGTFLAVEALRRGGDPLDAGTEVLQRIADSYELTEDDQVGLIVLSRDGTWAGVSLRTGFRVAVRTADVDELREPEHVLIA